MNKNLFNIGRNLIQPSKFYDLFEYNNIKINNKFNRKILKLNINDDNLNDIEIGKPKDFLSKYKINQNQKSYQSEYFSAFGIRQEGDRG